MAVTCSAATFCCTLRNGQNGMSACLVLLPVSLYCLTLPADWKLFVSGKLCPPDILWLFSAEPHLSLYCLITKFSLVLSCLFF